MYIFRILYTSFIGDTTRSGAGKTSPETLVIFSHHLSVDAHGECVVFHDRYTQQTKYLFIGEPRCQLCNKCSKRPLLLDSIHVENASIEVELKSRRLNVSDQAKDFFSNHGVRLSYPMKNAAQRERGYSPIFGDKQTVA